MAGPRGELLVAAFIQIFYFTTHILAFNLDTSVPIVKNGRYNSFFGFSVAQHQIDLTGTNTSVQHVFLVGAPRDNITDATADNSVRRLKNPGVLYSCPVSSYTDDCESVKIDRLPPKSYEGRDNQWLGVSVRSQGTPNGKAVVCAHRRMKQGSSFRWGIGMCITIINSLDVDVYHEPCSELPMDVNKNLWYGVCQSGTSVALHPNGDMLMGAPGTFKWRGELFENFIKDDLFGDPVTYGTRNDSTKPFSYLGMSTTIGKVLGGQTSYIGGAPRSENNGQVLMFKKPTVVNTKKLDLSRKNTLTGDKFGSLFGHDVITVDLNQDGREDLVVGAPLYHDTLVGGAIYVYINSEKGITQDTVPIKIVGRKEPSECRKLKCEHARFGFSLANIGDMDKDGYPDIAVGAPYEGNGAVYIFRGSKDGIIKEYAQRITAEDLKTARPLKTFGYSLSGGIDMDKNTYPDLVVGAFDSNKAMILRSRPVINVQSAFLSQKGNIDPKEKICAKNGQPNICFEINACFKFTAKPKNLFKDQLELEYTIKAEKPNENAPSRVFFHRNRAKAHSQHILYDTIFLHEQGKDQYKCKTHLVYINKNNRDFLNPVMFQMRYKLRDKPPPTMRPGDTVPSLNAYPVLNEKAAEKDLAVEFKKFCGSNQKCESDLSVFGKFELPVDKDGNAVLSLGEVSVLKLDVMVKNSGEDAHETVLTIELPESLAYTGISSNEKQYSCTPIRDINQVICNIGNPFPQNKTAHFTMRLDPSKIRPNIGNMHVNLHVNTTSTEKIVTNDHDYLYLKVIVRTDMLVRGYSEPPELFYGGEIVGESAIEFEDQIGGQVVHSYEIKNNGPGKVSNSTVIVYWPYEVENNTPQGKHLLYLMEQPEVDAPGKCMIKPGIVNPLGIKEDDSLKLQNVPKNTVVVSVVEKNDTDETDVIKYRRKREAIILPQPEKDSAGRTLDVVNMNCDRGSAKCHEIHCHVGEMRKRDSIVIRIRARLWNSTFVEDYHDVDFVRIQSKAKVIIDPTLNIQQDDLDNDIGYATTKAIPDLKIQPKPGVPQWVIVLAACGGLLLLALLILILWKLGFFKRKKVDENYGLYEGKVEKQKKYKYEDSDYS